MSHQNYSDLLNGMNQHQNEKQFVENNNQFINIPNHIVSILF